MAAPAGTLLQRLSRIQQENRIGRMTPGLGAQAAGWIRRRPADSAFLPDPASALRAGAALNRFDVREVEVQVATVRAAQNAEAIARRALTEAVEANTEARNASRLARQAAGAGGTSAVDRIRAKRINYGRLAAKAGRGVANPLLGMRMALGSAAGRAFIYTHIAGAAANGVVDLGLQVKELRRQTESPGEFRRLAANQLAGGALGIFGVRGLASGINRFNAFTRGGDLEEAERQFDRRWRETFTSREDAARMGIARRAEIARLRVEGDEAIARIDAYLRDYSPRTFTVATLDDREIYRRELKVVNRNAYNEETTAIRNATEKAVRELP